MIIIIINTEKNVKKENTALYKFKEQLKLQISKLILMLLFVLISCLLGDTATYFLLEMLQSVVNIIDFKMNKMSKTTRGIQITKYYLTISIDSE